VVLGLEYILMITNFVRRLDQSFPLRLPSCIQDKLKALGSSAEAAKGKPTSAVNPVTCHDYAGKFSIKPESLSTDQLVYLQACVDADIAYRRKGL
jgi:hypothetical protein